MSHLDDDPSESSPNASEWSESVTESALISDTLPVLCLREEYMGNANPNFIHGIETLDHQYENIRRIRGDGNCFFRAFIFALCEQLLIANNEPKTPDIRQSKTELVLIGYSEVAIDTFWETFVDYLETMDTRSHFELVHDFQTEGGESEYLVWYARLLTAGYLKAHADEFQPFIEGLYPGLTVAQFCAAEVEPMGKECDQPQIAALTQALSICVKIEYLDGSAGVNEQLQNYICGGSKDDVCIHLLYRPGHYDILYPKRMEDMINT